MRQPLRPAFVLGSMLALTGCSSLMNVPPKYSLADAKPEGHGLLLASMTADNTDGLPQASFTIVISNSDKPGAGDEQSVVAFTGCDMRHTGETEFGPECGRAIASDLPAGKYYIMNWSMMTGTSQYIIGPRTWVPIPFTIEAGKATYIGNIHLKLEHGTNHFGWPMIAAGFPITRNLRERDIPVFERMFPKLQPEDIDYQPIEFPDSDE